MKVFVTGGTGVLGRRLVPRLIEKGHEVVAMSRSDANDKRLSSLRALPARATLWDHKRLAAAMAGCDLVIHAATKIPTQTGKDYAVWRDNDRIRTDGTRNLLDAAREADVSRFHFQSIVWVAKPGPNSAAFAEDTAPSPLRATSSAVEGELITQGAARHGMATTVLRCGQFYAADSAHSQAFATGLINQKMAVVGRGSNRWAMIHADDAADAFAHAAENPSVQGCYHVVDDEAVTQRDFFNELANLLDAKKPPRVPAFLARLMIGSDITEFMTRDMATGNQALKATGWRPFHPTYREGLAAIVAAWRADDTLAQWTGEAAR